MRYFVMYDEHEDELDREIYSDTNPDCKPERGDPIVILFYQRKL